MSWAPRSETQFIYRVSAAGPYIDLDIYIGVQPSRNPLDDPFILLRFLFVDLPLVLLQTVRSRRIHAVNPPDVR